MLSQTHAAKSDALRRMLGLGGNVILQHLPSAGEAIGLGGVGRRLSMATGRKTVTSDVPAGLGNWDNSCYQNSILQALASLDSLKDWLRKAEPPHSDGSTTTTTTALQETVAKLRDPKNNGKHMWTPAKLKNMSSWQQQDAQEYFNKIMDELDKEAKKAFVGGRRFAGLETILEQTGSVEKEAPATAVLRNPLEGLVAQRVACTRCGFSEGYSMIPFNCLTVPLGPQMHYNLEDCLTEYTKSEDIEGVECRSCTLMQAAERLQKILVNAPFQPRASEMTEAITSPRTGNAMSLPSEIRTQIAQRLRAIEKALEEDDFADKTLKQDCAIPAKAYASTIKTREAIIGRAPHSLVVHINRSVFDERTGQQRKNYAHVRYPVVLDLRPWMLEPASSPPALFRLSAVVQHYGRHENGHYICYRRHARARPFADDDEEEGGKEEVLGGSFPSFGKEQWWRLSDEDVAPVDEEEVLDQSGAFMLFYERVDVDDSPPDSPHGNNTAVVGAIVSLPLVSAAAEECSSSSSSSSSTPHHHHHHHRSSSASSSTSLSLSSTPSLFTSSAHSIVSASETDDTSEPGGGRTEAEPAASPSVSVEDKQPQQPQQHPSPPPPAPILRTASPNMWLRRDEMGLNSPSRLMSV
jgi:ubiquitin carboxyl-terminal hydrolase 1